MPASLNDIYKSIGELTATAKDTHDKLDILTTEMAEAQRSSERYRANIRDELGKLVMRVTNVEADMGSVKNEVAGMRVVTDGVNELHQRAQGAGTLGRWLVRIGVGVVGFAGWLAAAYTWLTGRPPP